jgi:hypothetical protein
MTETKEAHRTMNRPESSPRGPQLHLDRMVDVAVAVLVIGVLILVRLQG